MKNRNSNKQPSNFKEDERKLINIVFVSDVELHDLNNNNEHLKGRIFVSCNVKIFDDTCGLNFQITEGWNYDTISTDLKPCHESGDDSQWLNNYCLEKDLDYDDVIEYIKEKGNIQKIWDNYVAKNYEDLDDIYDNREYNYLKLKTNKN